MPATGFDLAHLADAEVAETAMKDRLLAEAVATHQSMFFREKDTTNQQIDYYAAVSGNLQLVPEGFSRDALADDYARMIEGGMIPDVPKSFGEIMKACAELEIKERGEISG